MRTVQPARPQRGLIEMGLYVVALPMALSVGFMLAPIVAPMMWMFGPPSRR